MQKREMPVMAKQSIDLPVCSDRLKNGSCIGSLRQVLGRLIVEKPIQGNVDDFSDLESVARIGPGIVACTDGLPICAPDDETPGVVVKVLRTPEGRSRGRRASP